MTDEHGRTTAEIAEALVQSSRYKSERDDLQARIDAYEGRLEEWEAIDRLIAASSLGGVEAQRVRDTVPPQVGKALVVAVRHVERAVAAEQERDELRAALHVAQTAMTFFASVIKSGEPWTPECEQALRAALDGSPTGEDT